MSIKTYCDRCGGEVSVHGGGNTIKQDRPQILNVYKKYPDENMFYGDGTPRMSGYVSPTRTPSTYDLCKKCNFEFYEFLGFKRIKMKRSEIDPGPPHGSYDINLPDAEVEVWIWKQ